MMALLALVCIVPIASANPRVIVGGYFGPAYYGPGWYGPGWVAPTEGLRDASKLPQAATDYLKFISDQLEVEIGMISTGPERDATIIAPGTQFASWL